jgi:multiple sugar transport system substrate-binding protein
MGRITDMSHFRRVLVQLLIAGVEAVTLASCGQPGAEPTPVAPSYHGVRVVVAAVGDPGILPTVSAQRGEWEASRGGTCVVREKPVEPSDLGDAQVVVFRGDRLGDLVDARALDVLPEELFLPPSPHEASSAANEAPDRPAAAAESSLAVDTLQFEDVIPAFRDQVSKYGSDRIALPIGGSALVLVLNRAAFDRSENRSAATAAGVALAAPKTWTELDSLARFFEGRDWDGDGSKDHGIALPLGLDPEGVGDAIFLARSAALGQHRDHYSLLFDSDAMEPRIATPPFVEALQALVALKSCGPPGTEGFDSEAARRAFREGKVALLIDRAERAGSWGGPGAKAIGVAPLPGSERVWEPVRKVWGRASPLNQPSYLPFGGGWLVGVTPTVKGRERDAALDFVRYLINPETSNRVRSDRDFRMLPVRASQVAQGLLDPRSAPGVESPQWSEAVDKTFVARRIVPGLRIPGANGYLDDLSKGRAAAAKGEPAESALRHVSEAWAARTRALGPDRQLWHYRRSLNSLVTSSQPPER